MLKTSLHGPQLQTEELTAEDVFSPYDRVLNLTAYSFFIVVYPSNGRLYSKN